MTGRRVLDLGSGPGRHAAHLASLGAKVTAVDASPAQHQRALTRYPDHPGLHLVCADAVAHLRAADPYDLIYSVGSVPCLDPNRLLPALANGLKPGGRLVFSELHTNSDGAGPSNEVTPRTETLRLPGTTQDHPVNIWVLTRQLWEDLLVQHCLTLESVTAIDSPHRTTPSPTGCTLPGAPTACRAAPAPAHRHHRTRLWAWASSFMGRTESCSSSITSFTTAREPPDRGPTRKPGLH
ncbi:class I SAM-dependent methyltransferase, partial [Streptomyces spectabilis]|uniref:class I SAM-dependent methyltransferase n=1 Tax=Streptomyces spectabilis TaxID=68270 RepID=UPI003409D53B